MQWLRENTSELLVPSDGDVPPVVGEYEVGDNGLPVFSVFSELVTSGVTPFFQFWCFSLEIRESSWLEKMFPRFLNWNRDHAAPHADVEVCVWGCSFSSWLGCLILTLFEKWFYFESCSNTSYISDVDASLCVLYKHAVVNNHMISIQ